MADRIGRSYSGSVYPSYLRSAAMSSAAEAPGDALVQGRRSLQEYQFGDRKVEGLRYDRLRTRETGDQHSARAHVPRDQMGSAGVAARSGVGTLSLRRDPRSKTALTTRHPFH